MTAPDASRALALAADLTNLLAPRPHAQVLLVGPAGTVDHRHHTVAACGFTPVTFAPGDDPATAWLDPRVDAVWCAPDTPALHTADGGRLLVHNLASLLLPGGVLLLADTGTRYDHHCERSGLVAHPGVPGAWRRTERRTVHDLVADARATVARISPRSLHATLAADPDLVVLDTRTDTDRARLGCIAGSVHAPRTVLEWLSDPASGYSHPRITSFYQPLVVVCNGGYSSSLAAASLRQIGFTDTADLIGGLTAWAKAGLPLVPADHSHHDPEVPVRRQRAR